MADEQSPQPAQSSAEDHRRNSPRWRSPLLAVAVTAAALWAAQFSLAFRGLDASDAFSYAQIARNLARGHGYVTQESMPYEFRRFDRVPHAELMHPPLQAGAIALFFLVLGPREWAAVLPAALSYVLAAVLVFAAARRAAGGLAGAFAAALVLAHPAAANYAQSALAESLYSLLLTASVLSVAASREEKRWLPLLGVGALLGLTDLARETTRYLLPIVLFVLWGPREGRARRLAAPLAGFALVTLPNFARIALATGSPFTSYGRSLLMADIPPFAGLDWYRSMSPLDPVSYLLSTPGPLEAKIGFNLALIVARLPDVISPLLLLGLLAAWIRGPASWIRRTAALTCLALVLQAGVSVLFRIDFRHFVPFVPLLAILTSAVALSEARRGGRIRRVVIALLLLGALAPPALVRARQFQRPSRSYQTALASQRAVADFARRETGPGDLVITDLSDVVAWRADRRTVWFPLTEGLLIRIPRHGGERHCLLISSIGLRARPSPWIRYLTTTGAPPGFDPVAALSRPDVFARLFRQRPLPAALDSLSSPRSYGPDSLVHGAR
jgi:4-amino-4-deoxy-L-arabinose transferase-like glycosyltransferase